MSQGQTGEDFVQSLRRRNERNPVQRLLTQTFKASIGVNNHVKILFPFVVQATVSCTKR